MNIYKEWFGKSGLLARFYSCHDGAKLRYFVDYNGCRQTSEIVITVINGSYNLVFKQGDVPMKYRKEIKTLLERSYQF